MKRASYDPWSPPEVPLSEGVVTEFKEVEPGLWFPMHYEKRNYDRAELRAGRTRYWNDRGFHIDTVNMHSNYPISLFRDIPFPDGLTVHVIENGKNTRSYVQGGRAFSSPAKSNRP